MELLLVALAGLAAAAGAVMFPGMLNMTIISVSLQRGRNAAYLFALGVVTMFLLQASIGAIGARFLTMNPEIIATVKVWAIPIFLGLSTFFFYRGYRRHKRRTAKKPHKRDPATMKSLYLGGLSLGLMNVLAIPYFYALSIWLFGQQIIISTLPAKILFVICAAVGAYGFFSTYATLAPWFKKNARPLTRNINYVVGSLLMMVAIVQAFRVYSLGN